MTTIEKALLYSKTPVDKAHKFQQKLIQTMCDAAAGHTDFEQFSDIADDLVIDAMKLGGPYA